MGMFSAIYVEEGISSNHRVQTIINQFPNLPVISIEHYGELFNRKAQNFRLQKRRPALIIAEKHKNFVLPAPEGYGFGDNNSYYFSHMLNCIYDCRYCFLQGMYRSANYVLFINYQNFVDELEKVINACNGEKCYFYSGYDCDSLALEPVTNFVEYFLPLFRNKANAILELRTKSTQIRSLLDVEPFDNCVVAMSFTPENIATSLEHKVPTINKRIDAIKRLQERGWPIALRFEPLIYQTNYKSSYSELFETIFTEIDSSALHSVSIGTFRMPDAYFRSLNKLYPDEKLFAAKLAKTNNMVSYKKDIEDELSYFCQQKLLEFITEDIYYQCTLTN